MRRRPVLLFCLGEAGWDAGSRLLIECVHLVSESVCSEGELDYWAGESDFSETESVDSLADSVFSPFLAAPSKFSSSCGRKG